MKQKCRGSSIVEMIGVTALMAAIMVGTLSMYSYAKEHYGTNQKDNDQSNLITSNNRKEIQEKTLITMKKTPIVEDAQPIAKIEKPIIEKITENHYHFESLIIVLKYIGLGLLSAALLFGFIRIIKSLKKSLIVNKAINKSKKIILDFDNNFDENKNYLPFMRNLSDQVIINSVLIENRKNKDGVLNLIVNNEQLKTRLNLIETTLITRVA